MECVLWLKLVLDGNVYNVGLRIERNGLGVSGGCSDDFRYRAQRRGKNRRTVSRAISPPFNIQR